MLPLVVTPVASVMLPVLAVAVTLPVPAFTLAFCAMLSPLKDTLPLFDAIDPLMLRVPLPVPALRLTPLFAETPPAPMLSGLCAASVTEPARALMAPAPVARPPTISMLMLPLIATTAPKVSGCELLKLMSPLVWVMLTGPVSARVPPLLLKLPLTVSPPAPERVPPVWL